MSEADPLSKMRACGADCEACPLAELQAPMESEPNPGSLFHLVGPGPAMDETRSLRPMTGIAGRALQGALKTLGVQRGHVSWVPTVACYAEDLKGLTASIERANREAQRLYRRALVAWTKEYEKKKAKAVLHGDSMPAEDMPWLPTSLRTPQECCRPRLMHDLKHAHNIVACGSGAIKALLGSGASMTKLRGGMIEGVLAYDAAANAAHVIDVGPGVVGQPIRLLPTFEPGHVQKEPRWTRAFHTDLGRAVSWFRGTLTFAEPEIIWHPKADVLRAFLHAPGALYAADVETDGIEALNASLRCIAIGNSERVVLVGVRSKNEPPREPLDTPTRGAWQSSPWYTADELAAVLQVLCDWLADPTTVVIGHNFGVYDFLNLLGQLGVTSCGIIDTLQLHKLVEPELPHNLGYVASVFAPAVKAWKADRDGRKMATESESDEELGRYCAMDVCQTFRIAAPLYAAVEVRQQASLIAKDHAVQRICSEMKWVGMWIDQDARQVEEDRLVKEIIALRKQLQHAASLADFNPGSTQQLNALLFDAWQIPKPATLKAKEWWTTGGAHSSKDVVLRSLLALPALPQDIRAFILLLRRYRKRCKLLGTYVAKLRPTSDRVTFTEYDEDEEDEEGRAEVEYREKYGIEKRGVIWPNGRVHPGHNNLTNVGRLNCGKPMNVYNVPKALRHLFRAAPGHVLVGADADTFHVRIFSALWGIKMYLEAFELGEDAHVRTARATFGADVFDSAPGRPCEANGFEWTDQAGTMRKTGKVVQFASAYGAGDETVHSVITATENKKTGELEFLHLTLPKVRLLRANWLSQVPELMAGWAHEQALFDTYGFLADPIDGRRKDFLDGPTPSDLANYRTIACEAALMNGAMIECTKAVPAECWGPGTGLIVQNYDSMLFEVPDTGVSVGPNGRLVAAKGSPADYTMEVLRSNLNYTHPALPGVRFTSTPKLGMTWRDVS